MNRPLYETQEDLDNETEAIQILCNTFGRTYKKLPISFNIDFAILKDKQISALCEVKCRKIASTDFDTLMISQSKFMRGIQLSDYFQMMGTPVHFIILARWTDKLGYYQWDSTEDRKLFRHEVGGRTKQKRDSADEEIVIHIPICLFKMF